MTDLNSLLRSVITNPDDDTVRWAYADCLEENGDPKRAALIRAELRVSDQLKIECKCGYYGIDFCSRCAKLKGLRWQYAEARRDIKDEVFLEIDGKKLHRLDFHEKTNYILWRQKWERGFCSEIRYSGPVFMEIADALIWNPDQNRECPPTAQPIRKVHLTSPVLSSGRSDYVPMPAIWYMQKWPGIEFALPEVR